MLVILPSLSYDYNNALKIVSFFGAMNILTKITELDICNLLFAIPLLVVLANYFEDV
jgi:hypothetical protein